jgi:hypothetical protein
MMDLAKDHAVSRAKLQTDLNEAVLEFEGKLAEIA